jgi:hypothetical protein
MISRTGKDCKLNISQGQVIILVIVRNSIIGIINLYSNRKLIKTAEYFKVNIT